MKNPHPTLSTIAKSVEFGDEESNKKIASLAQDMLDTMYDEAGIGLAAPQVDVSQRLIVIDIAHRNVNKEPEIFVNPVITWSAETNKTYQEGCLSVPGVVADISRPESIQLSWQDVDGNKHEKDFNGMRAIVIQHEIDHLEGLLFIDHLSKMRQNILKRKMRKNKTR